MPKERVYDLAKQYGLSNRVVIEKLTELGIVVKSHSSTLNDEQTRQLAEAMKQGGGVMAANEAKKEAATSTEATPNAPMRQGGQKAEADAPAQQARQDADLAQDRADGADISNQSREARSDAARAQGQPQRQQGQPQRQQGQQGQPQRQQGQQGGQQGRQGQPQRQQGQQGGQQGQPQRQQGQQDGQQGQPQRQQSQQDGQQGQQGQPQRQQSQQGGQQGRQGQPQRQQGQQGGQQGRQGQPQRQQGQQGGQQGRQGQPQRQQGQPQRQQGQQGQPQRQQGGPQRQQGQQGTNDANRQQGRQGGQRPNADAKGRPPRQQGNQSAGLQTSQPPKLQTRPAGGQQSRQQGKPGAQQPRQAPRPQMLQPPKMSAKKRRVLKEQKREAMLEAALQETLQAQAQEDGVKLIRIGKTVVVKDLCEALDAPVTDVMTRLIRVGIMVNVNQEIDFYTASNIAEAYEFIVEEEEDDDLLKLAFAEDDENDPDRVERPPVVVVMGHVDHGKTSLLDSIRDSNVTQSEAGGITQHIGAYTVTIGGKPITFLDTPGHEAFTAMRMRGARVTDIAILVVAADDGVMPQTIEAINHAKAAGVEIIVAINKIDKPSANADRVKQELVEYGLLVEDWGGETICAPVSAHTGEGIEHLLEMIILVSEMKELKANPDKNARGAVIEAMLDKGRGPVATVLVQNGTLRVGDPIVAGKAYGKIRAMMDDKGRKVKASGPSKPVEILGLSEAPQAGDAFYVAENEKQARQYAESVIAQGRVELIKDTPGKVSLNDLFNQIQAGSVKDLNIVVKADVQGSVEAVKNSLERLSNDEVHIKTIHGGVGAITESDVMLASASNAIIIGFNVRPEASAKSVAEAEKVDLRLYRIIYGAIEDITAAMKGLLDPVYEEKVIGHAEIRQLFKASGVGTIAGSYVTDGKFTRASKVRITRDSKVVYDGELDTLKRFKDDVKEVNAGYECGLLFHKFNDIKEGDQVEAFIMEEIPR